MSLLPTPTSRDHKGHNQRGDTSCLTGALLPTPRASDTGTPGRRASEGFRPPLSEVLLKLLPTPRTSDTNGAGSHGSGGPDLRSVVALLPTPRATDGTKGGPNQRGSSGDLMLPSAVQPERWGAYGAAVARWEGVTGRQAPSPTEPGKIGQPRLAPEFVEWLMGLPAGWVTDHVPRNGALKCLGNGVVWQQAAHAYRSLIEGAS